MHNLIKPIERGNRRLALGIEGVDTNKFRVNLTLRKLSTHTSMWLIGADLVGRSASNFVSNLKSAKKLKPGKAVFGEFIWWNLEDHLQRHWYRIVKHSSKDADISIALSDHPLVQGDKEIYLRTNPEVNEIISVLSELNIK